MNISLLLIIILLSVATVNSLLLIIKREKSIINNKMLGWSLLFYNVFLLVYFVWFEAGFILKSPHMLRSVSPLMYLSAPFFYFYIRNSIEGTKGFRKYDSIHLLPALIHFVDLIPFYIQPYEVKFDLVVQIVENPFMINKLGNGLIPMSFHYPFRSFLQIIYLGISVNLVISKRPKLLLEINRNKLKNWLYYSLILMGFVIIAHFGYSFFEMLKNFEILDWSGLVSFFSRMALLGILVLNLYINFNPDFVFGYKEEENIEEIINLENVLVEAELKTEEKQPVKKNIKESLPTGVSELDLLTVKKRMEYLLDEGAFLENGISLATFSKQMGLSPKIISMVIHRYFEKGFNELINCYRVRYAIAEIQNGYLDDYTIDSLSEKAGFNSRITFFNAFKKEVGYSPNEYWKKFVNGQIEEEE
ncbi:helix-turn-helix domain-containing protein [Belliella pelovolcani]|uniref:AraC-type DNA-binding protein n=1 Tax=Belliella pelovolcani TaxID=529505 RepID=A0A1N7Q612_9BACT|nr:AraC family transcriptional regulator [Belliella pelovolcani]SIT18283.1 AraC-type DNA-binding protein [Belliella pelovolcani]